MTFEVDITGIKLVKSSNRAGRYSILAFADVHVPELALSLYGVALTHKPSTGYRALPPRLEVEDQRPGRRRNAVEWGTASPLALAIGERLAQSYEAFGGKAPSDAAPEPEPDPEESETNGLHRFVGGDLGVAEAHAQAGL